MPKAKLIITGALLAGYELTIISWLWLGSPPEWFRIYFYNIAWWPLLALIETFAELLWHDSLLYRRPWAFVILCLASSPFWTLYEIVNAGIANWIYVNLPDNSWVRWSNYALAYASVLPAIRVYLDLLNPKLPTWEDAQKPAALNWGLLLGLTQLALCLVFPTLFYPLAWSFLFFLTEPLLLKTDPSRSFLAHWLRSRWDLTVKTLIAGFLAGATWEFLNWKSHAKWIYTIPEDAVIFKIFEMPVLGYIGFVAFALCAESFSSLILSLRLKHSWGRTLAALSGIAVCLAGFWLIDVYTWKR